METRIELDEVKAFASDLSPWAHLATVGADGNPDVVPIHPCWEGDTLWALVGLGSVKARNVAAHPNVAIHWQVSEVGDGVEIWGPPRCTMTSTPSDAFGTACSTTT